MFGSFGLGLGSGQVGSGLNDNSEETKETEENSSFRHPESDFYREEEEQQLKNAATDEQTSYQIDSTARNYHASSDSETEAAARHEPPPLQEDHQYKFSSPPDYGFENSQQLNPPSETNPQMQSLDTFPNAMVNIYLLTKIHHTVTSSLRRSNQVFFLIIVSIKAFKMQENLIFTTHLSQQNTTIPLPLPLAVPWLR